MKEVRARAPKAIDQGVNENILTAMCAREFAAKVDARLWAKQELVYHQDSRLGGIQKSP